MHCGDQSILLYSGATAQACQLQPKQQLIGPDSLPRTIDRVDVFERYMHHCLPLVGGDPFTADEEQKFTLRQRSDFPVGQAGHWHGKQRVECTLKEYLEKPQAWRQKNRLWRAPISFPGELSYPVHSAYQLMEQACQEKRPLSETNLNCRIKDRKEMLAAAFDVGGDYRDGWSSATNGLTLLFETSAHALALQVVWLLRSIGIGATAWNRAKVGSSQVVVFNHLAAIPFRKFNPPTSDRLRRSSSYSRMRITPIGIHRAYSICLESCGTLEPLYLLGDFTPVKAPLHRAYEW